MTTEFDFKVLGALAVGRVKPIKQYLNRGFSVNNQDEEGMTLLMLALQQNRPEVVEFLLTQEPDLYVTNKQGENAFLLAERLGHNKLYRMMALHCWKLEEALFKFTYLATPNFETDVVMAYVNCWMLTTDFNTARQRSQELIEEQNWNLEHLDDVVQVFRGDYTPSDEGYPHYLQAMIDKEVLVFYTTTKRH